MRVPLGNGLVSGPIIAVLMIGALAAVLKWTFGGDMNRPSSTAGEPAGPDDYGLLSPVAVVDTLAEADTIRAQLGAAAIRATVSRGGDSRYRVLVFESDLDRARRALPT